jgi:hypothetical protein
MQASELGDETHNRSRVTHIDLRSDPVLRDSRLLSTKGSIHP